MEGIINSCPASTLTPPASHLFFALINTLVASQCALGPEGQYPADYGNNLHDGDEFDFIVVGAGSAGAIVANRLSQIKDWKILLLEAGGYPPAINEIPALLFSLQNTNVDWQYKMEPCKTCCLGLEGNVCGCARGKTLGGSSTINAMMYIRGNQKDYNGWEEAGNVGWDYQSVIKQYRKFEKSDGPNSGELSTSKYKYEEPIREILTDAYNELGIYQEYQEEKPLGFMDIDMTIYKGSRLSSAKSFLSTVKDRQNLHAAVNAQVSRLVLDKSKKIVNGVEVKVNDKIVNIKAKREVILSAGAINSPQILMNSGIGPRKFLQKLGIDVVSDLKVGENLQDHAIFPLMISIDQSVVRSRTDLEKLDDVYGYFMHKKGPLTGIGLTNFVGFVNTKNSSIYPDMQLIHTIHEPKDPYLLEIMLKSFTVPNEIIQYFKENNQQNAAMMLAPLLLKPKSRGKILLRNADPFEKPMIFPNYYSDEGNEDIETVLKGIKIIQQLLQTETFRKYDAKLIKFTLPNCEEFAFNSDDFWRCAIRNMGSHVYHQVGTCKMGPKVDSAAVVDPRLRVHGVKGLRVIDASIMPTITSGNTNAPTIMIGQKGSELIKEDWLKDYHDEL